MESDPNAKLALEKKIREIQQVHQLDLNSDMIQEQEEQEDEDKPIRKQLSNLIINAAVLGAVALKKSPIPGKFYLYLFTCLLISFRRCI